MEPAAWGILGTLIGALASIGTTFINNGHNSRISKEEREEKLRIESNAFQRETLLRLLDEIDEFTVLVIEFHILDIHQKDQIDGDKRHDMFMKSVRKRDAIYLLIQRVLNDEIREGFSNINTQFKTLLRHKIGIPELKKNVEIHQDMIRDFVLLIGEALRETYSD
ncbi:MAG: hypothetical protein RLN81_13785 [Balneolaceae bacterium]